MYETELAHHMRECDSIDEYTFCMSCGSIVYPHGCENFKTYAAGVMCWRCVQEQRATEADANDAGVMSFDEWKEHWQAFCGVPVPR